MRYKKLIILSTSITILFATFYFIKKLHNKKTVQTVKQSKKPQKDAPEITVKNFNIKNPDIKQKTDWQIFAKKAKIFRKKDEIKCNQNKCILSQNFKDIAELNSKKLLLNKNKKKLFILGNITGNYHDLKIKGTKANYDYSKQIIKSKDALEYFYTNFYLSAKESYFDLNENIIEMKNGIRSEINLD